jgi:hypothetical protein
MFGELEFGSEFFEGLTAIDQEIAAKLAAEACPLCGGRLHQGNYLRKPRGGLLASAAEKFRVRFSLCCGRDGCRRRATPPSVRFLGRRVYVGAAVIAASIITLARSTAAAAQRDTGISARTTRRWLRWWRGGFVRTAEFVNIAARIVGIDRKRLPASILEHIAGPAEMAVERLLGWLAPLTTTSTPDGSRFVRGLV